MTELQPDVWIQRARSNLNLAKQREQGIMLEDLCFEAQQSAEKALKAMLLHFGGDYPKTHALGLLVEMLDEFIAIPENVREVVDLTDYAVQTRYPGDYFPINETEYQKALEIAEAVLSWASAKIGS